MDKIIEQATKEGVRIATKHMKICSISLVSEIQIKAIMRLYFTSTTAAQIKKSDYNC